MTTARGFSKIIILLLLFFISAYIAMAYFQVTPHSVRDAIRTTGRSLIGDARDAAVDRAVEEGRQAVGEKLKSTGEKILGTDAPPGQFTSYTTDLVGVQPYTIIFFTGTSCTVCAAVHAHINSHRDAIPHDVMILEASYDDNALRQEFAVHEPATFIAVDHAGSNEALDQYTH